MSTENKQPEKSQNQGVSKAERALQGLYDAEAFLEGRGSNKLTSQQWDEWKKVTSRFAQLVKRLAPNANPKPRAVPIPE